ncbi:hypothetical protein [Roseovarius sp. MBR-6]|uniref:hypothetical protein n=1 Tax=Roseovarius sp. MBR-6 TaxID=3156459 RepID=UPI00339B5538
MNDATIGSPGRRSVLAMLGGVAAVGLVPARRAQARSTAVSALVFDGDTLVIAGAQVRRLSNGVSVLPAPRAAIRALACHPARPGRIFAALEGGGLDRSDTGGRTWRAASGGLPRAQVTALAVAAGAPDTVYAVVAGDGLWRSEDAGGTWAFVMDRPWIAGAEREVLTLASVDLATGMGGIWIYAGTERGLARVPDCFCRWQDVVAGDAMDALVAGTPPAPEAPLPPDEPVTALVSALAVPERLYAALPSGLWASADGGVIWHRAFDLHATALAVHPTDPTHIAAITAAGVMTSHDGGATWTTLTAL